MNLLNLPSVLHYHIITFLDLSTIMNSIRYLNKSFKLCLDPRSHLICKLVEIHLNIPKEIQLEGNIYRALLTLANSPEKILNFVGYFTDGGAFAGSSRFYVHHMFHYSAAAYTADDISRNVLTAAYYEPDIETLGFDDVINEDLNSIFRERFWIVPTQYRSNHIVYDRFMKNLPPRTIDTFSSQDYMEDRPECVPVSLGSIRSIDRERKTLLQTICDKEFQKFGTATRIGIARPACASCPVRTLCVSTSYEQSPINLEAFHGATSLKALLETPDLPEISHKVMNDDYIFIEFKGQKGPLCWVQFLNPAFTQIEEPLVKLRQLMNVEVLLIDIDDRRQEFDQDELGMDISYVVFGGYDGLFKKPTSMKIHDYLMDIDEI